MYEGNKKKKKKKTIILSQNDEMTRQSNEANDLSSSCFRAFFRLEKSKDYVEPVLILLRII